METIEQLVKKASELQPVERLRLVEAILFGLDNPDTKIEQSWVEEAEQRFEAFKRGEIETTSWEDIKKSLES